MKKESKLRRALKRALGRKDLGGAFKRMEAVATTDLTRPLVQDRSTSLGGADRLIPMSQQELLVAYRKTGGKSLAAMIYRDHLHIVLAGALRILGDRDDAQDAAAEIFAKVLERLRRETPSNFAGWLYVVTRNHCFEVLRKVKQSPVLEPLDGLRQFPDSTMDANVLEENRVLVETQVRKALSQLPDHQRDCIQLFFFGDRSYKEIAESLGYELGEVKSFIQNGKRRMASLLAPLRSQHVSDGMY